MKKYFLICGTYFLFLNLANAAIPQKDNLDYASQISIAKSEDQPMSVRWNALLKASEVANYNQILEIKKFALSKDWYMRNATLVALQKINVDHAIDEAQMLLSDKALVVRSAAVDILASKFTRENRQILANELSKNYNFSNKQSLWIRSKIFNIISKRASLDDRQFLAKYLFDSDSKIVNMAITNLERLTDVRFEANKSVSQWREYVRKNNWL